MNLEIKRKITDIIIILLLLGCVIGLFYSVKEIRSDGGKCVQNPLSYYNSLGKDKCTVTCLGGSSLNNKLINEPVANQFNVSELDNLLR